MNHLLRQALEDQESSPDPTTQASILLKGPLSEVYAQALYLTHGKEVQSQDKPEVAVPAPSEEVAAVMESLKVSMETLQMDQQILSRMAKLINPIKGEPAEVPPQSVYTVSKRGVDEQVVVDITREIVNTPGDRRGDFILVIDACTPGRMSEEQTVQERYLRFGTAIESIVEAHGGKVFHSFGEFIASRH